MNIVFLLAAQTAKTTADHIRGILGALIIPAVILIIVLIGKAVGKRSAKKIIADLQSKHPFTESFGNVHFTEDGLILIEHADDLSKAYGTRNGKLAIAYKLADIKFVCPYVNRLRIVNRYGHGNSYTDFFIVAFLDKNNDPVVPINVGKKQLSKSELKKMAKGTRANGLSLSTEEEQEEAIARIQRHAPHVERLDYEEMKIRRDLKKHLPKE
ncbi:MAG: hypothetical protein J6040_10260 [Clostridiales bacterium]|nr:hypothetical protein [Clostridiales bacterium]